MVMVAVGLLAYRVCGDSDVIVGMGFPPVPCKGIVIAVVTPVSAITRLAAAFPIAEGVNVIYIQQLWPAEIVPTHEYPPKAKLVLLVPVIVVLVMLTGLALVLLR
jgi:hypothetical protein